MLVVLSGGGVASRSSTSVRSGPARSPSTGLAPVQPQLVDELLSWHMSGPFERWPREERGERCPIEGSLSGAVHVHVRVAVAWSMLACPLAVRFGWGVKWSAAPSPSREDGHGAACSAIGGDGPNARAVGQGVHHRESRLLGGDVVVVDIHCGVLVVTDADGVVVAGIGTRVGHQPGERLAHRVGGRV